MESVHGRNVQHCVTKQRSARLGLGIGPIIIVITRMRTTGKVEGDIFYSRQVSRHTMVSWITKPKYRIGVHI